MDERGCGILLHISSLPSPFGIGDLGPWAYKFAEFLHEAKQRYWQILPLGPTEIGKGNSPYNTASAFAGNPLFISAEAIVNDLNLGRSLINSTPTFPLKFVDYEKVTLYKTKVLERVFEEVGIRVGDGYSDFCSQNAGWLEDYALYSVLKTYYNGLPWYMWPKEHRLRNPKEIEVFKKEKKKLIEREKFVQYMFFSQWERLRRWCNEQGIRIIGDLPIYVSYDSADVWANTELFKLDSNLKPTYVSGVPPDYFSRNGQLWGNPVYDWSRHREEGYRWWLQRMEHALKMYDYVRIDHFRGFVAYWEVRAGARTARNGQWVPGPGQEIFDVFFNRFGTLPIIAEDLGVITEDVRTLMATYKIPGMRVLQFGFDGDMKDNIHAPHNHVRKCVVYTGTHDNNTARGWYMEEARPKAKKRLERYIGVKVSGENVHRHLIRLAMMSVANTAIIPMQDLLGLGPEARMNTPATPEGNWQWRMKPRDLTKGLKKDLATLTEVYGRG